MSTRATLRAWGTLAAVTLAAPAWAGDGSIYFLVRPDLRHCDAPQCGGFYAGRANQQETECFDRKLADECYVTAIDPAPGAPLSPESVTRAMDARAGRPAIVRARVESRSFASFGTFGALSALETWRAVGAGPPRGRLWIVDDAGIRCVKAPCPSLRVRALGERETVLVSDLDLDDVHASAADLAAASNARFAGGVIVAGAIRPGAEPGSDVFVVSQLWLRTSMLPPSTAPHSAAAPGDPARP